MAWSWNLIQHDFPVNRARCERRITMLLQVAMEQLDHTSEFKNDWGQVWL